MLAARFKEHSSCSLSPCKSVSSADFGSLHTLGHVMPFSGVRDINHERNANPEWSKSNSQPHC
jgi:hypothetical protein